MKENIYVICAHSDDQILGPGGAMAKYAAEGHNIITVILSYGELTPPWYKPQEIIKRRIKEARIVDKMIGGGGVYFFGIKETKFKKEFTRKKEEEIIKLFKRFPPHKIFTHVTDDSHPFHVFTAEKVKALCKRKKITAPIYGFDVWKLVNTKHRNQPKLVVDISNTFSTKIRALRSFKSQIFVISFFLIKVYYQAIVQGVRYGYHYAEVFYRL